MKHSILSITVQKGGTGKTTTAAAIASAAGRAGLYVLAIDLDPQGNLSYLTDADIKEPGAYEVITGEIPAKDSIQTTEHGFDIMPASYNLAGLRTSQGSAWRLRRALEPILKYYDLIVLDTPPGAGEIQYNALQASTGVVVPLLADAFSIQGLYQVNDTITAIRQGNRQPFYKSCILTFAHERESLYKIIQKQVQDKAAAMNFHFLGSVHEAAAIRQAQAVQQSIYDYAPRCRPAKDYNSIFQKIFTDLSNDHTAD